MKTVLVNNYYAGITARGVIAQVNNLCGILEENNVEVRMLRAPFWLRRLPRQGVLFHIFEQFYVPLVGLFYDVVIYPYNSASVFSVLHKGSLLIIHDFIQNRKKIAGFDKMSARLVRWTQAWYRLFSRDVAYITDEVARQSKWIQAFPRARTFILPNSFHFFKKHVTAVGSSNPSRRILLCTGKVPTKNLSGALKLFFATPTLEAMPVSVIGLGVPGGAEYFTECVRAFGRSSAAFEILPMISDQELASVYMKCDIVWVHSDLEGFGRNVAEGLLAGKRVLASRIPPFMKQAKTSANVFLYKNGDLADFQAAADACMSAKFGEAWADPQHAKLMLNLELLVNGKLFV